MKKSINRTAVYSSSVALFVLRKESASFSYDADNRLIRAQGKNGDTVEYTQENRYNGFGQRVQKKEGSAETNYFYDGTSVLYTTDASDAVTAFNVIGAEDNILTTARFDGDAVSFYIVWDIAMHMINMEEWQLI